MIDRSETEEWARRFGVRTAQIRRDHFISHVLHALGQLNPSTRFFGGTALCRTYLNETRLSEDIDLLHAEPRKLLAALQEALPKRTRREFPDVTWSPEWAEGDGLARSLVSPDVDAVKLYVGRDGANTSAWEFAETNIRLRYADLLGSYRSSVRPFQLSPR